MRQHVSIDFATLLLPIARQAGDASISLYSSGQSGVREKADHSPVTEAGLAAHVVLVEALRSLSPGYPVVSEEDECSPVYRNGLGCFWLIDPLDGTKEFIARNGGLTVNIALIDQGRSVLGVVYAPAIDCMYWGGPGWLHSERQPQIRS
ncbi:3'(2'),5'-bisphosphate nucleotidase CysQ family protein [Pseudomonas kuykendallii]|uniref:3'(2'),5'-bisphosphate nucleotidase CysQ family protein n=1 Tax=Pseudomonas kuykendallii TaxID=1007099 RepID=UPI002357BB5F|nr:inositol monophosphatase family protein [Pseudomonas kuykendallii]